MTKKKQKVFTLQEANELVPELRKRLKHLQLQKETYSRLHDTLFMHEPVRTAERSNGFFEKDDLEENIHDLEQAIEDLAKDVEAIFAMGCILRSIEKGQVDFPAVFEDKRIFWSWQQDEPAVGHYRHVKDKDGERLHIPSRVLDLGKKKTSKS